MKIYTVNGYKKIRYYAIFVWAGLSIGAMKLGVSTFTDLGEYREWLNGKENPLAVWYFAVIFLHILLLILALILKRSNWIQISDDFLRASIMDINLKRKFQLPLSEIEDFLVKDNELVFITKTGSLRIHSDFLQGNYEAISRMLSKKL